MMHPATELTINGQRPGRPEKNNHEVVYNHVILRSPAGAPAGLETALFLKLRDRQVICAFIF